MGIKFRLFMLVLFGLTLMPPAGSSAETDIWKWTDENGTIHYTDNFLRIPEKFQDEVEKSSVRSAPSASKPSSKQSSVEPTNEPPQQKAAKAADGEKVDLKTIEAMKGLIVQIKSEIQRDQKFQKWRANKIAYFKLLNSLKGGLVVKKKLLADLQAAQHTEIIIEMEWVSKNVAFEYGLLNTTLPGHYSAKTSHRFRVAMKEIQGALPGKKKVVADMGKKVKWLKANYAQERAE